ncbi:vWA domain-containing protein [Pararhodobacter aggregans]|uniref:VWA domain-containing protein n=1 Tax=Pararhodobacter aggregans TaxID=404875 RepID=A0A2T7UX43_9RHOB|nr:nitric oxide reductase activation protein NorD [Pararhodobacter aggregans]PTX05021.1 von Willebrand factor type A domain-containing protein [Pararhodobacter aggregans]PVE49337.1 VWA domain-containing protein [Pararhodobacter aggregans]
MPPSPPGSDLAAALEAARPEAIRRLSPRGLEIWQKGAEALTQMGRGEAVVLAWIEAAPQIAREIGEEVLADLAPACLTFASRTSGAVIERILATAPLAARRLGDAGLFRSYLRFLDHLLSRAPRALRPMLDHLGALLDVLTLGGLRRWADWGAEAHRTDYRELDRYFSLVSAESKAVLQRERKGVLLVDVQRRLGMYLRALWGRDFLLVPTAGDVETRAGLQPFIEGPALHLPDALDDWQDLPALDLYRAQVAHLAAHLGCLRKPFQGEGLSALQSLCIGLIEDARAEALAIARFPRLRDLWAPFHQGEGPGLGGQVDRIARALLLGQASEDAPLERWILDLFQTSDLQSPDQSRDLGLRLADRLKGQTFSAWADRPSCPYRCDNRVLWTFEELEIDSAPAQTPQLRKYVSIMEMVNEVEVETAGADAQEIWVQAHELFDDDGSSVNDREGKEPLSPPIPYDEFDHQIQLMRPAWANVLEKRPRLGDPTKAEAILDRHRKVMESLRHRLDAMRPQGTIRVRKLEDGDELDLNAAVSAAIDTRLRRQPDPRVMMRLDRKIRDTAVMVLLDLSESTNDPTAGGETVLDLTQSACVLLAEAIHRVGDAFALHGFQSDGRQQVFYSRFKDFTAPWDTMAKARLMGAEGRLSTRMGTAIRHATHHLGQVKASRKLMIVLTDGAPADIDVKDPLSLRADARRAVEEAARQGVTPFCLSLDPGADAYVTRIFGPRNALVLDRVDRLPERLPQLYAALTR